MAASSHVGFCAGNIRPPTKCNCGFQLDFQINFFGVDRIYSFGVIAILRLWHFDLKLPIHVAISGTHAQWSRFAYSTSNFRAGV